MHSWEFTTEKQIIFEQANKQANQNLQNDNNILIHSIRFTKLWETRQ